MVDALVFLVSITVILLAGIAAAMTAKKTRLPLPLLLFIAGLILGNIFYAGRPIIDLGSSFLTTFSIVALIIVLFEFSSRLSFKHFDKSMQDSLLMFILSFVFNAIFLSFVAKLVFDLHWFATIILAVLISCIEYFAVFSRNNEPHDKVTQLLKDESIISCAVMVLLPFVLLSFISKTYSPVLGFAAFKILPFFINLVGGIGIGVIISILLYKLLHMRLPEKFSLFLFAAAIIASFILAQQIDGNGFVAVATMGLIFGNVYMREKASLYKHLHTLNSALELFVFIIVGAVVGLPSNFTFYKLSFGLFVLYLVIRFIAAQIVLKKHEFAERLEVALFVPKGIATITAAFALLNYFFSGVIILVQLLLVFFVYSLIFDTILAKAGVYKSR